MKKHPFDQIICVAFVLTVTTHTQLNWPERCWEYLTYPVYFVGDLFGQHVVENPVTVPIDQEAERNQK